MTFRIRVIGRKEPKGPFGVVNSLEGENASCAAGEMPVVALRRLAQSQAFLWNRNYHPDWEFRIEEKSL